LRILLSPQYEVTSVLPIGDKHLVVTYKDIENENKPLAFSNVVLSAFISSWARLRLYDMIEKVGYEKVLYVDTDSIMYVQNKNEESPLSTGCYLGQLTREIEDGWNMIMFVGLGPKNYAYKIRNIQTGKEKHIMKIRGITLNKRARKKINFDLFYDLVMRKTEKKVIYSPNNISRKPGFVIVSRPERKTHQVTKNKRRLIIQDIQTTDFRTLPYGYRQ